MNTKKLTAIGAGILLVGASVLGTSTAAFAATLHGPYGTKSACTAAAGNYELHGYVISRNCYYQNSPAGWFFITTF